MEDQINLAGMQDICCIGANRLGAFTMLALAHRYPTKKIFVVDVDINLITRWNQDPPPFSEPELENLVAQHRNQNVFFHDNVVGAIQQCRFIFLAIEMRTKKEGIGEKGRIEIDKWKTMVHVIRDNANDVKYIVDKSAVPFELRNTIVSVLEPSQFAHHIYTNPEFFSQGSAFQTLLNPERVVFGSRTINSDVTLLHELYHFVPHRVVISDDVRSVDFAKCFCNTLLGVMGTLANIASTFADDLNMDVNPIFQIVDGEDRLGHGFLRPNVAVGGPALQKDMAYMAYMAEEYNHKEIATLFKMFIEVNKKRKEQFVKKMLDSMFSLKGTTIVILGFAFKAGTKDVSDSPSIHICELLLKKEKANLRIHDPIVHGQVIKRCLNATHGQLAQHLQILPLNPQLFQDAHAICVMTRAPEFLHPNIDYTYIPQLMRNPPYFFDFTGNDGFNLGAIRLAGFHGYSSGHQFHHDLEQI